MDALSIYWNAIWKDALRPRPHGDAPHSAADAAAFARRLRRAPKLFYSTAAGRWLRCDQRRRIGDTNADQGGRGSRWPQGRMVAT